MTAATLHVQALALIAERKALAEAGTPGRWHVEFAGDLNDKKAMVCDVLREKYGDNALDFGEDHATARMVVAAVNAFSRDTDALAEVLDRHRPWGSEPGYCTALHALSIAWPCADAAAALRALGVQ